LERIAPALLQTTTSPHARNALQVSLSTYLFKDIISQAFS
jgi:hypothetical protein